MRVLNTFPYYKLEKKDYIVEEIEAKNYKKQKIYLKGYVVKEYLFGDTYQFVYLIDIVYKNQYRTILFYKTPTFKKELLECIIFTSEVFINKEYIHNKNYKRIAI